MTLLKVKSRPVGRYERIFHVASYSQAIATFSDGRGYRRRKYLPNPYRGGRCHVMTRAIEWMNEIWCYGNQRVKADIGLSAIFMSYVFYCSVYSLHSYFGRCHVVRI